MMDKTHLVRKLVKKIAEELKLKSSNHYPSDADLYVGFKFGDHQQTANENEYDPVTGELMSNTDIATASSYLQQWDADNVGYVEEDDVQRDNGIGLVKLVMQQITPIK